MVLTRSIHRRRGRVRHLAFAALALAGLLAAAPAAAQRKPAPATPPAPGTTPAPAPVPAIPGIPAVPARPIVFGFLLDAGPPVTVKRLIPGSPVDRAGLRAGDEILVIGGRPATLDEIYATSERLTPGDTVVMRVRRDGRERVVTVVTAAPFAAVPFAPPVMDGSWTFVLPDTLSFRFTPDSFHFRMDSLFTKRDWAALSDIGPLVDVGDLTLFSPIPGARLTTLDPALAAYFPGATRGLLVLDVRRGSDAAEAGFAAGDVIVGVDGAAVGDVHELRERLRSRGERSVTVVRHGERVTLRLR